MGRSSSALPRASASNSREFLSMMLVNLWMLKSRNGMYWYALDYFKRVDVPTTFLVRKRKSSLFKNNLEDAGFEVKEVGLLGLAVTMLGCMLSGRFVFTPTPHPVPLLRNQVLVVHDLFPFSGRFGALKRLLFRFGIKTSGATIAHINRSICLSFLDQMALPQGSKFIFAPNVPPVLDDSVSGTAANARSQKIMMGAFGTDSPKKSYESLLSHPAWNGRLKLRIYGHDNNYVRRLRERFGANSFDLVSSDETSVSQFIQSVDGVLSVAQGEGFGRPLATAIAAKVPCHLLDSPAFREFFDGNARFYDDIASLLDGVARGERVRELRPTGFLSPDHGLAIDVAAAYMRRLAGE